MKTKRTGIILLVVLALAVLAFTGYFVFRQHPDNEYRRAITAMQSALDRQDYQSVYEEADKAIAMEPENDDAYRLKAEAALKQNDYNTALLMFEKIYDLTGDEADKTNADEARASVEEAKAEAEQADQHADEYAVLKGSWDNNGISQFDIDPAARTFKYIKSADVIQTNGNAVITRTAEREYTVTDPKSGKSFVLSIDPFNPTYLNIDGQVFRKVSDEMIY